MNENVIAFPAPRKPGRPRQRPIPNTPPADVLALPSHDEAKRLRNETPDFDQLLDLVSFHLLMAGRAIASYGKERQKG